MADKLTETQKTLLRVIVWTCWRLREVTPNERRLFILLVWRHTIDKNYYRRTAWPGRAFNNLKELGYVTTEYTPTQKALDTPGLGILVTDFPTNSL